MEPLLNEWCKNKKNKNCAEDWTPSSVSSCKGPSLCIYKSTKLGETEKSPTSMKRVRDLLGGFAVL